MATSSKSSTKSSTKKVSTPKTTSTKTSGKTSILIPKSGKIGSTNKADYTEVKVSSSKLKSSGGSITSSSKKDTKALNSAVAAVRANNPATPAIQNPVTPVAQTPIDATTLTQTPQAYTPPAPQPVTGNMSVANDTTASQVGTEATSPITEPLTQTQQLQQNLSTELASLKAQLDPNYAAQQTAKFEKDAQLAKKRTKALQISSELDKLDLNFNNDVREIRKNSEGKFAGAIEQDVATAQETYEYRRANVSIAYKVALGDYEGAQEDVDRKVQAFKEANTQRLNLLQYGLSFLQASKNDLTDSEKIKLNAAIDMQSKQQSQVLNAYSAITALAVQNGASAATLDAIDKAAKAPNATVANVYAAAGSYAVDKSAKLDERLKQLSINQKNLEISKLNNEINNPGTVAPKVYSINGVDSVWDANTNSFKPITTQQNTSEYSLATSKAKVDSLSALAKDSYLNSAVGPSSLARTSVLEKFTGGRGNFVASVEQITKGLTLDTLISAKKNGATFGALSIPELELLARTATKINSWAIREDGKPDGKVVGYQTTEKAFKQELDKITKFSKLDYILKGGNPDDIQVSMMPDGTIWGKDSFGNPMQIK